MNLHQGMNLYWEIEWTIDLSLEEDGIMECYLAPATAVLRNLLTNGG